MRYLVGLVLLAGCATVAEPPQIAGPCMVDEQVRMRFVGTEFRMNMRDELQAASRSRIARTLRPGEITTKEYFADRLNILLDENGRIAGLRCG